MPEKILYKAAKEKTNFSFAARIILIIVALFLAVYVITVVTESKAYINGFARRNADLHFGTDLAGVEALAQVHYDNLYEIAARVEYADSTQMVLDVLCTYEHAPQFGDLRFHVRGVSYSFNGLEVDAEVSGHDLIMALADTRKAGCTPIYFDENQGIDCMAFFIPIKGSAYIDGLVSIVPARDVIRTDDILREDSAALLLVSGGGRVYSSARNSRLFNEIGNDFYAYINDLTHDKETAVRIQQAVLQSERTTCVIDTPRGSYILVMSPVSAFGQQLTLVSMSESDRFIAPELQYIRHVVNLSVAALAALLIGAIYVFFYYKRTKSTISYVSQNDLIAGCPNAEQFRTEADRLLHNREIGYALVVMEIRQFRYLEEGKGENDIREILQYLAKVIGTFCKLRETFGYLGEGKFGLLMTCKSEDAVHERIRVIEAVSDKSTVLGGNKTKRKFNVGVAMITDGKRHSAQDYIGYAQTACERARNDMNKPLVAYTEEINTERIHNDRIEAEMESALANDEFRLFLQPKYDVATDRIESAEALVRWFDTKTGDYRFPGEFIGLFEQNGFITKLDHFMYLETLKYLSTAAERHEKIVPISVNVSLVTVSNESFLDFYIENKKKFQVPDQFITLEFTESFAMEDFKKIRVIVDKLHQNGIRCSLDDFGSGYSSFGVLKNIPFDEIKFDRLFLQPGYDKKHDDVMFDTLISLAKSLNIRVVQEGVETEEVFNRLISKGCDVIQGYYYAKAIPLAEYRLFVASNTSIKYKSRVK